MQNSLYITGEYSTFVKNYILAKRSNLPSAIVYCLQSLNKCFVDWEEEFNLNNYQNNINLVTLCKLLKSDTKPLAPLKWKLKVYKEHLTFNNLTFKDHLIESFLVHINKATVVYSTYSKEYKLLYFIAREIKYGLFKIIRKICQYCKRDYTTNRTTSYSITQIQTDTYINSDLYFLFSQNRLLYSIILSIVHDEISWKEIKLKYELSNTQLKKLKSEAHEWISKAL